uniref:Inactive ribonuclease-like protein 9 n=1 Tax=Macaca nemestrina TaxID=9545 RepID=A0A2K6DUU1_MACNE|nr:inactive ribonuclease-like protein 9 isoform X1 [Macaca nemestrina]XP_011765338.1 inactive ribonuclease-like protein 9 isoform X2 [Macaca nemestrina]XP_011765339.1 inactive ribonuclease-like protein 9 isoform X1 [Macaca nemestrina]XP_011765340.1 inactive ribonuclease-like protein 9 isoform X2 [Macaca nemestrina]
MSTGKMMRTPITTHPLLLLLLLQQLLQPVQFQVVDTDFDSPEDKMEEFREYLEEFRRTGPTRPPTKENVERRVIIEPGMPLYHRDYCNEEIMRKNIYHKQRCVTEHYFLLMQYDELEKICYNRFVPCKNGVRKCNRSKGLVEGVYCNLTEAFKIPRCKYKSFYRRGYVLITCAWQNEIHKLIPHTINDLVEPPKHRSFLNEDGVFVIPP